MFFLLLCLEKTHCVVVVMTFRFDTTGIMEDMELNLSKYIPGTETNAFRIEALLVLRKAIRNTPIKTGWLRSSAFINSVGSTKNKKVVISMGYGATYASSVHENPMGISYSGGEDHYLSNAIESRRSDLISRVRKRVDSYGGGVKGYHRSKRDLETKIAGLKRDLAQYYKKAIATGEKSKEEQSQTMINIMSMGGVW